VYLQISTNIATPSGVSATEGIYTNRIRVTWQGVAGATGYEIWRSRTNSGDSAGRIASIAADTALVRTEQANIEHPTSNIERRMDQPLRSTLDASRSTSTYTYDDYAISPILSYYYWVRAKTGSLISPMSYVGMGYAALDPEEATGTADIAVSDMVYLPVNATNASHAGTVSFRLANLGPDALNAAGVAFDFQMGTSAAAMVWIGSAQSNMTLVAGGEKLIILTASAKHSLTVRGDLSGIQQVQVTVRHLSTLEDPDLANNITTAAGSVRIKTSGVNSPGRSLNDYDGDGKADLALWHAGRNLWAMCLSGPQYSYISELYAGNTGDLTVPGDYDGDGLTDIAIYCHLNGWWNVRLSSNEQIEKEYFIGGPAFTAAQCDFDGDSKTDPMVYRETDGYWLGQASSRQYALSDAYLGETGYQSVAADYDGDGLADPAVYNRTTGLWVISLSGRGYQPLVTGTFGGSGYLPATADYDGDGLADPAVYAPGTAYWQVLMSGTVCYSFLGSAGGMSVPADYDGDGLADPAVFHQDTGFWELFLSTQDYQLVWGLFGGPEYQPVTE
ncbi:MAG: VCBS repeat-containing protein, partial [Verrucomicrobia bacterium]|nr:VCBS repeat-containing protein [Verrucomicrobiota bacterium]